VLLQHPDELIFREPCSLHPSVLQEGLTKSPWRKISVAGHRSTRPRVALDHSCADPRRVSREAACRASASRNQIRRSLFSFVAFS
jgi:hypothetical protein